MNILISTICFISENRVGSRIYTTFANRLIDDVMTKSPFDMMLTTNMVEDFLDAKNKWGDRLSIVNNTLTNHKVDVKVFNQLLKFLAFCNIDSKYDYVVYLDCDQGMFENINLSEIEVKFKEWDDSGYDMFALRTDTTYKTELEKYNNYYKLEIKNYWEQPLFYNKFIFYGVNPNLIGACLPSEHMIIFKNNYKLPIMSLEFEKFCYLFESQDQSQPVTVDMEAFEIGVFSCFFKALFAPL